MQQVVLCCECGTVGGVSVQQVDLWCVCVCVGQLGGVSVQQVDLWCVCGTVWGNECAGGGFVL